MTTLAPCPRATLPHNHIDSSGKLGKGQNEVNYTQSTKTVDFGDVMLLTDTILLKFNRHRKENRLLLQDVPQQSCLPRNRESETESGGMHVLMLRLQHRILACTPDDSTLISRQHTGIHLQPHQEFHSGPAPPSTHDAPRKINVYPAATVS